MGNARGRPSDPCPTPPGATGDGCVISARLSRLTPSGNVAIGPEQVLVEDWCQQYPSHSIGQLEFGADGALYVSGGDGASFNFADWGQDGSPLNPVETRRAVSGRLAPPHRGRRCAAQPGSAHLRRPGHPGRDDPARGRQHGPRPSDNPLFSSSDPNARRIIAQGLRNPFRFTIRPGTNEVWLGDVGSGTWEEINRIPTRPIPWTISAGPATRALPSGRLRRSQPEHLREPLRQGPAAVRPPYFTYDHGAQVVPGESALPAAPRSPALLSTKADLPGVVRRSPLLHRLLPRLHLGHVPWCGWAYDPAARSTFSRRRRKSGRSPDRAERRPLLR